MCVEANPRDSASELGDKPIIVTTKVARRIDDGAVCFAMVRFCMLLWCESERDPIRYEINPNCAP